MAQSHVCLVSIPMLLYCCIVFILHYPRITDLDRWKSTVAGMGYMTKFQKIFKNFATLVQLFLCYGVG